MDAFDPSVFELRYRSDSKSRENLLNATGCLGWLWAALSIALVFTCEPEFFSRVGSIGVLYAGLHYGIYRSIVDDAEKTVFEIETVARLVHVWAATVKLYREEHEQALRLLASYDQTADTQGQTLVRIQKKKSHRAEAIIFCLSTIQWGFGDVIFNAINKQVVAQC